MPEPSQSIEEAAERIICAILDEFGDMDDDDLIPVKEFFLEMAKVIGVDERDCDELPEWETVAWMRERSRWARSALAAGETIT